MSINEPITARYISLTHLRINFTSLLIAVDGILSVFAAIFPFSVDLK